jgi:hypothetical protein
MGAARQGVEEEVAEAVTGEMDLGRHAVGEHDAISRNAAPFGLCAQIAPRRRMVGELPQHAAFDRGVRSRIQTSNTSGMILKV